MNVCKICNSTQLKVKHRLQDIDIHQCNACGTASWRWQDVDFASLYSKAYFVGRNSNSGYDDYFKLRQAYDLNFAKRLARIEKLHTFTARRLLDIGCGPGFFLDVARAAQWDVQGLEISEFAAQYAQQELNLNVVTTAFKPGVFANPNQFDLITMWDFIEHAPEPLEVLNEAARLLTPNGILALTTGDICSLFARFQGRRWHLLNLPEHLFFFSRKGLTMALEKAGFAVLSMQYSWSYYPLDYLLERLEKSLGDSKQWTLRNKIPLQVRHVCLPVNLYDILFVVARKKLFTPLTP